MADTKKIDAGLRAALAGRWGGPSLPPPDTASLKSCHAEAETDWRSTTLPKQSPPDHVARATQEWDGGQL